MTKRLHTDSKIIFSNPYVVMLEHRSAGDGYLGDNFEYDFQKLTRKVYKQIQGTWGYCKPQSEYIFPEKDSKKPTLSSIAGAFTPIYGMPTVMRSYWVFKDEIDALHFRLMIGEKAMRVYMWPQRYFTIHEVVETDES